MSNTSAYLFPTIYKSHLWVGFRKRKKLFPNTALFLMFLIFSARFLYLPPVGGISLVCFHKNHHLLLSAWWEKCVYATLTSGWKALLKREIIGYKALILLEILGFFSYLRTGKQLLPTWLSAFPHQQNSGFSCSVPCQEVYCTIPG